MTKRSRTTPLAVAPTDSAIPLLEIEAVIVAHIKVRRAAVASLIVAPMSHAPDALPYLRHNRRTK